MRGLQRLVAQVQARSGDRLLTWLTILLVVFTFVIVPLHAAEVIVVPGYSFVILLIMASCIVSAPTGIGGVAAMLLGVGLGLAAVAMRYLDAPRSGLYLDAAAWIAVAVTLAYVVARAVFGPGRVTYHRVMGAVLLYLTIGQIFVGIYGMIDLLAPQAFSALNCKSFDLI